MKIKQFKQKKGMRYRTYRLLKFLNIKFIKVGHPDHIGNIQIQLKHVVLAFFALILFLYTFANLYTTARVDGISMVPTLHNEDFLLIRKYWFLSPKRGEIISTKLDEKHNQDKEGTSVVKRVIGLPGEIVEFKNRRFSIINQEKGYIKFKENYLIDPQLTPSWSGEERRFLVPEGQYFVLGDNREISQDSRDYGTILEENIIGKVIYKLPSVFKIKRPEYDFKYKSLQSIVFEKIRKDEEERILKEKALEEEQKNDTEKTTELE